MFKLVKVLGSNTTAEPLRVGFKGDFPAFAGSIYYLNNGVLSQYTETENDDRLIALQNLPEGSNEKTVHCILLAPDMVFEVTVDNHPENVVAGEHFLLSVGGQNKILGINTNIEDNYGGMDGTVIDASTYKTTGKVLVKFFCPGKKGE